MKSFLSFLAFLSLLLFAGTVAAARKDTGEYWRAVMKDQPIPEAIKSLDGIDAAASSSSSSSSSEKTNCHDKPESIHVMKEEKIIVEDLELPRPNNKYNNEGEKKKKSFANDFEPRPNISAYGDDSVEKSFAKDFEPRPNISAYGDDSEEKSFATDFEPRPNISAYGDDADLKGDKKSFVKD